MMMAVSLYSLYTAIFISARIYQAKTYQHHIAYKLAEYNSRPIHKLEVMEVLRLYM